MDIFQIAEENYLIAYGIVIAVGFLQGAILGRGIRNRFPSIKHHARAVSSILLVLFSVSAIANVIKFANPDKIPLSELTVPQSPEEFLSILVDVLGLNAGIGMAVATFISLTLILIFRFANIHSVARYFMFGLSVVVVATALVGRFTEFVPTPFQIVTYAFYQFGITVGIFVITARKSVDALPEIK